MNLSAGAKLGPYEILAPIGAGGMGEVYKALDPKLGREVAIKVLPELFFRDKERLARFERERTREPIRTKIHIVQNFFEELERLVPTKN